MTSYIAVSIAQKIKKGEICISKSIAADRMKLNTHVGPRTIFTPQ